MCFCLMTPNCGSFSDFFIKNCSHGRHSTDKKHIDDSVFNGKPIVSDATRFYFELFILVIANAIVSVFGTLSNIINIIVFAKMGVNDVVNVSLLCLAVSDLISVVFIVWCSICWGLSLLDPPGLPFDPITFLFVTAGWPHFIFSRVSCYITAMVSIERCLCVILPFKVKEIITPKRIKICLIFIFTAFPLAYIPVLSVHKLVRKFDRNHNETRIMLDFATNADRIQTISDYINDIFFPTLSIFTVIVSAIVTTRSLHRNAEWKKAKKIGHTLTSDVDSSSSKSNVISSKEVKVVRMLVIICVMFVICYAPYVMNLYAVSFHPEFAMFRAYHNLFVCIFSFVFLFEIFNSSFNIVVYYTMSSKFRFTLLELFNRGGQATHIVKK